MAEHPNVFLPCTVHQLIHNYKQFLRKIDNGEGIDLGKHYDLQTPYWLLPGENVMVSGDTGMGKSALVQNWVVEWQRPTLYLNLEMSENLLFRRFIQISMGLSKMDVNMLMRNGSNPAIMKQLEKKLQHIHILSVSPEVDEIHALCMKQWGKEERPLEIVVVDTTDMVSVPDSRGNVFFMEGRVINMMRRLAQELNIIVIGVHHLSKEGARMSFADLNALTGNRANVTKMDHVIVLEGLTQRDNQYSQNRRVRALKGRDQSIAMEVPVVFDGNTFRFREIETEQESSASRTHPQSTEWPHNTFELNGELEVKMPTEMASS